MGYSSKYHALTMLQHKKVDKLTKQLHESETQKNTQK